MSTVAWPTMSDYQEAIQAPRLCFSDPELQRGTAATDMLGLPRPITGAFASVYQIITGSKKFAVRCFLHYHPDQERRYAAISAALQSLKLPFMVEFTWQNQGIRVRGKWFPILKMEWLNGQTLDSYIGQHLDSPTLRSLAMQFADIISAMKNTGIAHGDLQHGNILVVNNKLRLIDYDGMYVPALQGMTSHEIGHRNYQLPRRSERDFGPHIDSFSAWVIYLALMALSIKPTLWRELKGGDEHLLFRKEDFDRPAGSAVLRAIQQLPDREVREMTSAFQNYFKSEPMAVPSLDGERIPFTPPARPISGGSSWLTDYVQGATSTRATRPAILPEEASAAHAAPTQKVDASWIRDYLPNTPAKSAPNASTPLASTLPTPQSLPTVLPSAPSQPPPMPTTTGVELSSDGDFEHRILNIYEGVVFLSGIMWAAGVLTPFIVLAVMLLGAGLMTGYLVTRYSGLPEVMDKRIIQAEIRDLRRQVDTSALELRTIQADMRRLDESQQFDIQQVRQQTLSGYIMNQLGKHRIEDANIPRVGGGLRNRLASAGIETAADVEVSRLYTIEGIGETLANRLLEWRQDVENQIRQRAANNFDAMKRDQERKVMAHYQSERDRLKIAEKTTQKQLAQLQKDLVREQEDLEDYQAVNGWEYFRRVVLR
ncbi:MAG: hypothetical protein K8L91_04915 [Anaerolineae bacterium]|nr:hypothetical protein [Anaerolineae bacterium]